MKQVAAAFSILAALVLVAAPAFAGSAKLSGANAVTGARVISPGSKVMLNPQPLPPASGKFGGLRAS